MLMNLNLNLKAIEKPLKHVKQETDMTVFIVLKDLYDRFVEDPLQGAGRV